MVKDKMLSVGGCQIRRLTDPRVKEDNSGRDVFEEVTEPDVSPSLYAMVMTGTVGAMPGNSANYSNPAMEDDDEAHEHPDYSKLSALDPVVLSEVSASLFDEADAVLKEAEEKRKLEDDEKKAKESSAKAAASEAKRKTEPSGTEGEEGHV